MKKTWLDQDVIGYTLGSKGHVQGYTNAFKYIPRHFDPHGEKQYFDIHQGTFPTAYQPYKTYTPNYQSMVLDVPMNHNVTRNEEKLLNGNGFSTIMVSLLFIFLISR